ncbi:MAG: GspE/PulE family protein [Isosphaeraceae bacterium]
MAATRAETLRATLRAKPPEAPEYATEVVDLLLQAVAEMGASDLHLQPVRDGLEVRWRVDGVLHPALVLPGTAGPRVVGRLKVLAELLTYKTEVPQEGRIRRAPGESEMRLSTLPTLHGEKAVVRLFAGTGRYKRLNDLGFPEELRDRLGSLLQATSGAVVFCGPAGSGKTTTIYACLRDLVETTEGRRSLATLEDPVEVPLDGVAQSQANPGAGFTMNVGLRALLRQDPEVIGVGEIRDRDTAEVAFQASLTGHLVLTTFHAGSAAEAVGRLADMGVEPYLLRSGLLAVVGQRLVRTLCGCSAWSDDPALRLGLDVSRFRVPVGCDACGGTGYRGRVILAEMLTTESDAVARAILGRAEVSRVEAAAVSAGMLTRWDRAAAAVEAGVTSPAEVRLVLGVRSGFATNSDAGP